ncbi:MAG: hypothetical protein Q8K48_01535 [Candidatus Planktophila sp.]|nr:hypothetical protein [Candidatus Planktophila sp.]
MTSSELLYSDPMVAATAAAGVTGKKLNHEEVIAAGKVAADRMGALLNGVIPKLF